MLPVFKQLEALLALEMKNLGGGKWERQMSSFVLLWAAEIMPDHSRTAEQKRLLYMPLNQMHNHFITCFEWQIRECSPCIFLHEAHFQGKQHTFNKNLFPQMPNNGEGNSNPLQQTHLPMKAGDTKDMSSIPGSGRCPGEGNSNPLQHSCLENSMDREAWWVTFHGVAKSWTWLSMHYLSFTMHIMFCCFSINLNSILSIKIEE